MYPHECDECGRRFKYHRLLKAHLQEDHGPAPELILRDEQRETFNAELQQMLIPSPGLPGTARACFVIFQVHSTD